MTELQFLVDLLLTKRKSSDLHKHIAQRIGEVEESLRSQPHRPIVNAQVSIPNLQQAPSTQRLLESHGMIAAPPILPIKLPAAEMDKETGRAMVATGNGTKGPRKF